MLTLTRPLAILDLETTGLDPAAARIVEISITKLFPGPPATPGILHASELYTRRHNPGIPIPPEATAIHGLADADVVGYPTFAECAGIVAGFLADCDLGGFNIRRYDLRVLLAEFRRAGVPFRLKGRLLVDVLEIFREHEPRDLAAAVRHYLGRDHDGAHGAAADVAATVAVLEAQLGRYADLPRTVGELAARYTEPGTIDFDGKFRWVGEEIVFTFGKYKDQSLYQIARIKPDYLQWFLGQDFYDDAKEIVRAALAGRRPDGISPPGWVAPITTLQ